MKEKKFTTGVIHGRFQILHNDHLNYIQSGFALCDHIVIGITNPDPGLTRDETSDPARSDLKENPLTYYERYLILKDTLMNKGMSHDDFSIVPFPFSTKCSIT